MPDKKSLDQLRLEKERAELRLAQEQRRLTRLENRKQYYEKGERAKRTHELCNIGGSEQSVQTQRIRTQKTLKEAADKPCSHSKNRCPSVAHRNYSFVEIAFID